MTATLRGLFTDRLVRLGLATWAGAALLKTLAAFRPTGPAAALGVLVDPALLTMTLVGLVTGRAGIVAARERRFWDLLAAAWVCSLIVEFFYFVELPLPFVSPSFAADALFILFYLNLALAVEVRPHLGAAPSLADTRRRLESTAGLLAIFGLLIYFALVDLPEPLRLSLSFTSRDRGLLPYLLARLSLDLILLGRLAYAAHRAPGRWRHLYGLLAAAMLGYALRDVVLLLEAEQKIPGSWLGLGWGLFLLLPGLLVFVAARYRHLPFPGSADGVRAASAESDDMTLASPLALYILVVPVLHFVLYPLGLLEESSRPAREVFCLLYLVAIGIVTAVHQKLSEKDRRQAVEALHDEISRRKRVNLELESRRAEMEQFSYTISHELKAPLVTIIGFSNLLERGLGKADPQQLRADLDQIRNAANGMRGLLAELLELSRAGWTTRRREPVSMTEIALSARDKLALLAPGASRDVRVEPGMPVVQGDASRLEQVFTNLITNAVKFRLPDRPPEIRIGCRREDEVVYYVADNGRGIDPRFHDKIFGLFDRLHPEVEGTGVGLALVRRIVEKHGGRAWVESEGEGRGATFCFTIPEPVAEEPEDDRVARPKERRKSDQRG